MKTKHLEIEETIFNYFHGYLNAEKEVLALAFHQNARLFSTENGNLVKTELEDWQTNLDERKVKGDIRKANVEILDIDVSDDAATVKTRLTFPKFAFTDYLSLLQIRGRWLIVNKIYSTEVFGEAK